MQARIHPNSLAHHRCLEHKTAGSQGVVMAHQFVPQLAFCGISTFSFCMQCRGNSAILAGLLLYQTTCKLRQCDRRDPAPKPVPTGHTAHAMKARRPQ